MHIEGRPERHGFVPVSYVRSASRAAPALTPVSAAPLVLPSEPAAPPPASAGSPSRASFVQALPEASLSSATLRSEALAALPPPAATAASAAWASASLLAPSAPGAAEEFTQLFSSHEAWFKAASAKRGEVYTSLRAEADEVRRALAESEARSAAVLARLGELEALVSAERQKWSEGLQL